MQKANTAPIKRIGEIDALKGIGIILVMMSHMIHCKYLTPLYGGFIPLFFISSGLTSSTLNIDVSSLKKKFIRLIIPYLVYSIFILFIYAVFCLETDNYHCILGIIYGRCRMFKESLNNISLLPRELAPLWFLPAMFVSYLCLAMRRYGGGNFIHFASNNILL